MANTLDYTIPNVINSNSILMLGVCIQFIGSVFLSVESIGVKKINSFFEFMRKFSKWYKKGYLRMSILPVGFCLIMITGLFHHSKIIAAIFLPTIVVSLIISLLIDNTDAIEKLLFSQNDGKVGPMGFIFISAGTLMQLISVIIQARN